MRTLLVAIALLLTTPALGGKPTPPAMAAEHAEAFERGDVVLVDDPQDSDAMYAYLSINAPRETVWKALNDAALIESSSSTITQCTPYVDETEGGVRTIKLHYVLSVAWSEVTYYIHRQHHIEENYLDWTLDKDKTSDILVADGYYVLEELGPSRTRLIYWSKSVSGRRVPAWVRDLLTGRALKGWLGTVKSTSEGT